MAETADAPSSERGAETLRRIGDQIQPLLRRDRLETLIVGRMAEQIDGDDAGRTQSRDPSRGKRRHDAHRIEIEILFPDVGEDRRRAYQRNGFSRGNEREGRDDNRIPGTDLPGSQRDLQTIGAVRAGNAMTNTGKASELPLEFAHLRTHDEGAMCEHAFDAL